MKWIALSIVVLIALVAIGVLFFRSPKKRQGGSDEDDGASNEHGTGSDGHDGGDSGGGD